MLPCGVAVVALAALAAPVAVQAQVQTFDFNIPAQDMASALRAFARQSRQQVVFDGAAVAGKRSPALVGRHSADAGLQMLLANSGLTATRGVQGALMIRPDPAAAPSQKSELEEVVVTARKATERLQDVPVAVTALGGARLLENGHIRIEDVNQLAPSTNVIVTNGRQTSFTIRGLGANPANDGLESSTGVFLDGVYLGRPGMAAMDFIDIQQIEILRGPQGTLYGKNTTAGAINITTALPSFDPGLLAQATLGNYNYQQYQASATGPLAEGLAGRLTAYSTTRGGIVDNVTLGEKTGTLDRRGVRGQLLYEAGDTFSARLVAEYNREQQSGGGGGTITSWGANVPALQAKLQALGARIAVDPDGLTTAAERHNATGARQSAASAELNWRFGDGFKLTSISAFRRWDYESDGDTDNISAEVTTGGVRIRDKQWSQELRLALPQNERFDAVVGAYYFAQRLEADSQTTYGVDAAAALSGVPNAQLPTVARSSPTVAALLAYNNSRWNVLANPSTDSYAGFGQATLHLSPAWNVTGGLRVTHERKRETVSRVNPVDRYTGRPVPGLASQTVAPISVAAKDTAVSYLLSTDYRISPDVMVYALISRGQKAGGVNAALPARGLGASSLVVRPETAMNYEAGLKSEFFERRLAVNLSLFRTDVEDYQASYLTSANGATLQYLTNVGDVRTQGAEAEATLRPFAGLTLNGFVGYTDAKYLSYTNAPCPIEVAGRSFCDLTGQQIAGAPKWTAGVNGAYEHQLSGALIAYASGEYSWRSEYFTSLDNSRYSVTGGYGLLNLRVGLRSEDGRWDIAAWGKNVTDVHLATNAFNFNSLLPGIYVVSVGDPATYGVTLRARF